MHRYLVERTFPDGLDLPDGEERAQLFASIGATNAAEGATWLHTGMSPMLLVQAVVRLASIGSGRRQ